MGNKSPWQREWDRKERSSALKELAVLVLFFGAFYLGWGVIHRHKVDEKIDNFNMSDIRGAAKHQAQMWLKEVRDAD
jgi:hypothetical protein